MKKLKIDLDGFKVIIREMLLQESSIIGEKLVLKKYDEYAKLVAKSYDEAPNYDSSAVKHWNTLNSSNYTWWKRLTSEAKIVFVSGEKKYEESEGVLYISIDYSDHPVFSIEDNIVFRTVHDYIVHIKGGFEFGLKGELSSYNLHAKLAPNGALPALFTEIVGQACYAVTKGGFPTQKIAVLEEFDHKRVGYVKGYDIEDKELKKSV